MFGPAFQTFCHEWANKASRADAFERWRLSIVLSCHRFSGCAAHRRRWNKMRRLHHLVICAMLLVGCSSREPARPPAISEGPVADLNRQIEKYNAERPGDMGITPIGQRVSRIEHAADGTAVSCFDAQGALFLILTRQPDGSFKGSLRTKYHELPKADGHSWGEVVAEFTLPQKMFQPDGPANGSQPIRSETNRTSSAAGSRR